MFREFLPYDDIRVGDHTGVGGAPWTEYTYVDEVVGETYTLHVGRQCYLNLTSSVRTPNFGVIRELFIHELTHVWQGSHSVLHGSYQVSSFLSQAWALLSTGDRGAAYDYVPGGDWFSYNVEQQANIVEDWFRAGAQPTHASYRYIQNNIRKP